LTGVLWVPTHNNPRFPAPRGTWEATGRRWTVMSCSSRPGESTPRTDVARADDRAERRMAVVRGRRRDHGSRNQQDAPVAPGSAIHTGSVARSAQRKAIACRHPDGSVSRWPRCRRPPKCADWRLRAGAQRRPGGRSMIACSDRRVTYGPPLSALRGRAASPSTAWYRARNGELYAQALTACRPVGVTWMSACRA
jgi:hypothetical protein